jgi:nicotinamide riboside kinase
MKLIGLTGSHGTGKSTIIRNLKGSIPVDERLISREVQKKLGWDDLERVKDFQDVMWTYQDSILDLMGERLEDSSESVLLVDRTPADAQAYARLWCDSFGVNWLTSQKAADYSERCARQCLKYHNFIYLPIEPDINFKAEKNRATLESQETVAKYILDFLVQYSLPYVILRTSDLTTRIKIVRGLCEESNSKNS